MPVDIVEASAVEHVDDRAAGCRQCRADLEHEQGVGVVHVIQRQHAGQLRRVVEAVDARQQHTDRAEVSAGEVAAKGQRGQVIVGRQGVSLRLLGHRVVLMHAAGNGDRAQSGNRRARPDTKVTDQGGCASVGDGRRTEHDEIAGRTK